jgi:hypothetical protein
MSTATLLSVVARVHPQVWDAIVPHTPQPGGRAALGLLNPQPLPPADAFLLAAAVMAHDLVRVAIETHVQGGESASLVREFIDEWCGTPWPRKWPTPWPGPPLGQGPSPVPWDVATARVVGAIVFASAGLRLAHADALGAVLTEGAERLAEAAVSF